MSLKAKVQAVNLAHKTALEAYPLLVTALTPFQGKKVLLASAMLTRKVREALPKFANVPHSGVQVWHDSRDAHKLLFTIKTCINENGIAHYYDYTLYVGKYNNDGHGFTLIGFYDAPELRTDYTVEEIKAKRAVVRTTQDAYYKAQQACHPFDVQHDN